MGRPRAAQPVVLICGMLAGDADILRRARQLLVRQFGPLRAESDIWPFDQTDYYADETGPNLKRCFVAFEKLVNPDVLVQTKLETNALERQIAEDLLTPDIARPVNLDPGYVDLGKLVLATTKDRSHRIYLGHGIYAEVTLNFADGAWRVMPWTYPDYRDQCYHAFFSRLRAELLAHRRSAERGDTSAPAADVPP
jgi:hypothetical protein